MTFNKDRFLNILKFTAWSSISIAAISITSLSGFIYHLQKKYETDKTSKQIEFIIIRNPEVASYSNTKIYINGQQKFDHFKSDSSGIISLSIETETGFRPVGKIDAILEVANRNAYALKIQYHEGTNTHTKFKIAPLLNECDSGCLSRINIRNKLDSLHKSISILQRKIDNEEL